MVIQHKDTNRRVHIVVAYVCTWTEAGRYVIDRYTFSNRNQVPQTRAHDSFPQENFHVYLDDKKGKKKYKSSIIGASKSHVLAFILSEPFAGSVSFDRALQSAPAAIQSAKTRRRSALSRLAFG